MIKCRLIPSREEIVIDTIQLKNLLKKKLANKERKIIYNKKEDKLRVEDINTGKGITLSLPGVMGRYEKDKEAAIDEVVYYIDEALNAMAVSEQLKGNETRIFPVIRSTSFPTEKNDGTKLVYRDHTAETRIFYAIDMNQSYQLITSTQLNEEGITQESIDEIARFNLKSLPAEPKKDEVAGNIFYFFNHNDGYDASRILNHRLIQGMEKQATGKLVAAVPHQDVLILGDIQNNQGYDVLAQMTMQFFTTGNIPITSLPFYVEDGQFNPIFIMAKKRPIEED